MCPGKGKMSESTQEIKASLEQRYFDLWKRKIYEKRAYRHVSGRLGQTPEDYSNRNYQDLRTRLRTRQDLPPCLKEHLQSIKTNSKTGLTTEETALLNMLISSKWYLTHITSSFENIETTKTLLSIHEIFLKNLSDNYCSSLINEFVDSIFFYISPGKLTNTSVNPELSQAGMAKIEIELDKIDPLALTGLFCSGVMYSFGASHTKNNDQAILYGTTFSISHRDEYSAENGLTQLKYYTSKKDDFIHRQSFDPTQEIFTFPILKKALSYSIIERIRHLGRSSWGNIYASLSSTSLESIHELVQNILNKHSYEAHLPRKLFLNQSGITITTNEDDSKNNLDTDEINKIGDHYVDAFGEALLAGNEQLVGYLLDSGWNLKNVIPAQITENGNIKLLSVIEITIKILCQMMGFKLNAAFEEASICPTMNMNDKRKLAVSVLEKLYKVGSVNVKNKHITYPLSTYTFYRLYLDGENTRFTRRDALEIQFLDLLEKVHCLDSLKPKPQRNIHSFHNKNTITTIFILENSYLLEYGTGYTSSPFHIRNICSVLEPIKFRTASPGSRFDDYIELLNTVKSDENYAKIIAERYYALPPKAISLIKTEIIDGSKIYYIHVIDKTHRKRLAESFKEQTILFEAIAHAKKIEKLSESTVEILKRNLRESIQTSTKPLIFSEGANLNSNSSFLPMHIKLQHLNRSNKTNAPSLQKR